MRRYRYGYNRKALGGGGFGSSAWDTLEGKWGVRAHQRQEMKGKDGLRGLGGREAKSGLASSGHGRDTLGEKGFFADRTGKGEGGGCEGGRGRASRCEIRGEEAEEVGMRG